MAYRVLVHHRARTYLNALQPKTRERIKRSLIELEKDPFKPRPNADIKKLAGTKNRKHAYRLRVGDYRVIYDVEGESVYATTIFLRGKDYQIDL